MLGQTMRHRWILRFTCLMQLAAGGILFTFEAVRMKDMGIGETTIGLILASSSAIFIPSSLLWGKLADRHHCHKKLVVFGTLCSAALMLYFSFCESTLQFFIYAITRSSVLMPIMMSVMPALAVSALGKNKRGSQYGIYRAFGSLGFILGTMILPLIFNDIGMAARVASVIALSSFFLIRKLPEPEDIKGPGAPLRLTRLNPLIFLFLISFFFIASAEPALHGFFHAYARELGGSTRLLGLLSGTMGVVAFVSLPVMGKVVDRTNPTMILSVAFAAQALRVLIVSLISDPNFLWIPVLLHGIAWGGVEVSAVVYLASLVKIDQKATVLSLYTSTRILGHLGGASLSGYLAETHGYTVMFHVITAGVLFGTLIYVTGGLVLRKSRLS
jgi:PPP family 3-phenylpropionic acid transporter